MQDILICSFYTPGGYYEECATRFKENVTELGLPVHVEEFTIPEGKTWPEVCRSKVEYVYRLRQENPDKFLFWIDIDCHLNYFPDFLRNSTADLIAFQRGFGDPLNIGYSRKTRFWEPCLLGIGTSAAAQRFLDSAYELEKTLTDINATDDYFYEEAWRREARNLTFQVIPSQLSKAHCQDRFFVFGSSSNVTKFKGKVVQHIPPEGFVHSPARSKESALPYSRSILRTAALRYLPAPVIAAIAKKRNAMREANAIKELLANPQQETRPVTLHNFNIWVKKSFTGEKAPSPDELEKLIPRVKEGPELARSSLAWGKAFHDYLHYGSGMPIDLVWWASPAPGNFGDWLSPYLTSRISGRPVRYLAHNKPRDMKHLVSLGSIGKFALRNSWVIGTGIADANTSMEPNATYVTVRGPYTAKCVRESGGKAPDLFGDPGILMSKVYQPPSREKTNSVALVRHIRHRPLNLTLPSYVEELSIWGARPEELETLVNNLATKDFVITSAMHCFIVCQSYGIPCALVSFEGAEDLVPGDGTKYDDYLSGVNLPERRPQPIPVDLTSISLSDLVTDDKVDERQINEVYLRTKEALTAL